uniref:Uncharacterized protein n=1 Tax=Junco hyemalis TaxID=40217 RepID=A0A8C5J1J0_JUNHY
MPQMLTAASQPDVLQAGEAHTQEKRARVISAQQWKDDCADFYEIFLVSPSLAWTLANFCLPELENNHCGYVLRGRKKSPSFARQDIFPFLALISIQG